MATIIDVAKLAGVSKSTVSRVITKNGYVSKETETKVIKAMHELEYYPNILARQFQAGKTRTIGFVSQVYIDSMQIFLREFVEVAKKYGYFINLYFTDGDREKEIEILEMMKFKQIDGVFIFTRTNDWSVIEDFAQYGPLATWHRRDSKKIYSPYFDHYDGYYESLNYLYNKGYQKIGHVVGHGANLNTQARLQAINDFYLEKKVDINQDWIITKLPLYEGGQYLAQEWIDKKEEIDALIFYSDYIAAQFLSAIQLMGYDSPRDIAMMGFDNTDIGRLMHISTIDYSIKHQAYNSFIYIYNQLTKKDIPFKELKMTLIERETTRSKVKEEKYGCDDL
ncbi:LacI family DNA-binding transcriptional regulator [Vagococcus jeotgali]|uniref:LacI family DNA-binding transcriptional regulator n=1 Tax=Vagococcus jeotgali TaxID=3109030 RepID=UPI002DDC5B66|nr:LacI family DNA-binding transcriptional regulator [Vagococcus sp. B2T-5]